MKQADEPRIARRESAGEQHAVFEAEFADAGAQRFAVNFVRASAGKDEQRVRIPLKNRGRLLNEPARVFDGVNAPDTQQHFAVADLRKRFARLFAEIPAVKIH